MTEKLIVDNFLGIKHIELELGDINVLIGPQATGKSVCAKLLYFFKNYFNYLPYNIIMNQGMINASTHYYTYNLEDDIFPLNFWGDSQPDLRYSYNDLSLRITNKYELLLDTSQNLEDFAAELSHENFNAASYEYLRKNYLIFENIVKSEFIKKFGDFLLYEQVFIPAGRSFFINLEKNIFQVLKENRS